jgi:hypothetical protein
LSYICTYIHTYMHMCSRKDTIRKEGFSGPSENFTEKTNPRWLGLRSDIWGLIWRCKTRVEYQIHSFETRRFYSAPSTKLVTKLYFHLYLQNTILQKLKSDSWLLNSRIQATQDTISSRKSEFRISGMESYVIIADFATNWKKVRIYTYIWYIFYITVCARLSEIVPGSCWKERDANSPIHMFTICIWIQCVSFNQNS